MTGLTSRVRVPVLWARLADITSSVLVSVAIFVAKTGGFTVVILGVRVAAHDPWRPALLACTITAIRLALTRKSVWIAHLVAAGVVVQAVAAHYQPGTGFTDLIAFGRQFEGRALPAVLATKPFVFEDSGYDGQFYAQMAVDPMLRDPSLAVALDNPGYRARRILFAWSAWLLGLGRPAWVLQAYALQNLLYWIALAWLLLRWFPLDGAARAFALWFGCLFADGLIGSLRFSLVDGPSLFLVVLVVAAAERDRPWAASRWLALSGLGKETSLLAGVALVRPGSWPRALPRLAAQTLLAVAPFVLWLAYVRWSAGFEMSPGGSNFSWPLMGYIEKWLVTLADLAASGFSSSARFSLYALVSLTAQAAYLLTRPRWTSAWWRVGAAHVALMVVLGWAVWDGYPGAVTRAVLPLTVAFNVLLVGERRFWWWFLAGNLTVLHDLELLGVPTLAAHL